MADLPISGLPPASMPLDGTEPLPMVQGGATVQGSAADVAALTGPGGSQGDVQTKDGATFAGLPVIGFVQWADGEANEVPIADGAGSGAWGPQSGGSPTQANVSAALANGYLMTVSPPDLTGTTQPALAGDGAGDLSNGVYRYKFTYVTANGETLPSAATDPVTVVDASSDGHILFFRPIEGLETVFPESINVYRTTAGGSTYLFHSNVTIDDNSIEDNTADAALGAAAPVTSTALESGYYVVGDGVFVPPFSPTTFGGENVWTVGCSGASLVNAVWLRTSNQVVGGNMLGWTITANTLALAGQGGDMSFSAGPGVSQGGSLFLQPGSGLVNGVINLYDTQGNIRIQVGSDGGVSQLPLASATPPATGSMVFELTSDTSLTIKVKGSDNVVRSAVLTLAP